ncbi:TRAP transporter small permease [Curvivirga sp.]|uniref:TRAP transporter small permease n=1 Tax=Curvivirga sp. TaxID=2856848 RepID=UPI003B596BE2
MLLSRFSNLLVSFETMILKCLMAGVLGLILLNVVTRSMSYAIYWVDEAAIYCMIWLVFVGSSVGIRKRQRIAVTLLFDAVPEKIRQILDIIIDGIIVIFAAFFIWVTWIWYDPLVLAEVGFNTESFAEETFNFIYDEPTNTVGIRKFWIWLILPVFGVTIFIHGLTNFYETLFHKQEKSDHPLTEGLD